MAASFAPAEAIYFLTWLTTDAFAGPNMSHYVRSGPSIKSVYVLRRSGAYGVGIADAFPKKPRRSHRSSGATSLIPRRADYTTCSPR